MRKVITVLCRFSREHRIIKKKKKEYRDRPSPVQVRLDVIGVLFLYSLCLERMGERTHTHSSVSYSWAHTTHVRPASSHVLSPVFSLNIRGDVTPPTAEMRSSSRGPSTPPHLPQLSPPARGWASHPQQQPDIGSFLSFFSGKKGKSSFGEGTHGGRDPSSKPRRPA